MKSETITGSILELVPPFVRIIRTFFLLEEFRKVEPVKGIEPRSDKRQDRPTTYIFDRKRGRIIGVKDLPPGVKVDFYI